MLMCFGSKHNVLSPDPARGPRVWGGPGIFVYSCHRLVLFFCCVCHNVSARGFHALPFRPRLGPLLGALVQPVRHSRATAFVVGVPYQDKASCIVWQRSSTSRHAAFGRGSFLSGAFEAVSATEGDRSRTSQGIQHP